MSVLTNPAFPDDLIDKVARGESTRNVIDHYRDWAVDDIAADLAATALPATVVLESLAHDFNTSGIVRTANVVNVSEVIIVGRRRWDRRGAVGAHHYTPVTHSPDPATLYQRFRDQGVPLIVSDNVPGSVLLPEFAWPEGPIAIAFGQEQIGISNVALKYADHVIAIPQRGSVRSMNVAVAAGIVLYDYMSRGSTAVG